jgi:hypothetical protein
VRDPSAALPLRLTSRSDRTFENTARAEEIYGTFVDDEDPKIEIDWDALAERVPALDGTLAKPGGEVLLGSTFGETPVWAKRGET